MMQYSNEPATSGKEYHNILVLIMMIRMREFLEGRSERKNMARSLEVDTHGAQLGKFDLLSKMKK